MTYAVIGMGAVGGYYGSRLAAAGHEVHFLLRSDYHHVQAHGYQVDSYLGSYHLHDLNIYDDVLTMPRCDVVFVAMKTTQNHRLTHLLPPLLKGDTLVVLLQNGIGVEADVERIIPGVKLAAGVAFINCMKVAPGRLSHMGFGHLTLADYNCGDIALLQRVADHFSHSQVPTQIGDYLETRWRKNILNMGTNGLTVKHNCNCDQLISNPEWCGEVRMLMEEGVRAARACGATRIGDELVDQLILTSSKTHFATSMKYDYDHGFPMEVDYLYTHPIREAMKHGCDFPHMKRLEQYLLQLEGRKIEE